MLMLHRLLYLYKMDTISLLPSASLFLWFQALFFSFPTWGYFPLCSVSQQCSTFQEIKDWFGNIRLFHPIFPTGSSPLELSSQPKTCWDFHPAGCSISSPLSWLLLPISLPEKCWVAQLARISHLCIHAASEAWSRGTSSCGAISTPFRLTPCRPPSG